MAAPLVLITGANGHIGFKVVVIALESGYKVRAAVRTQDKADKIRNAPSIKALNADDRLEFVLVTDLTQPGAYDAALKGVDYAIHLASPITSGATADKYESHIIEPAIKGTKNFLDAAEKTPTLKRVVITSSVVAQIKFSEFAAGDALDKVFKETSRTPDPEGPFESEFEAYSASKVRALNATEAWKKEKQPHFSLVHVHPSFVLGRDEMVTSADDFLRGTNGAAFAQVIAENPGPLPGSTVFLDDTARAHVRSLDSDIPDGQSIVTDSGDVNGITWSDTLDIVRKHFPQAVSDGTLPLKGSTKTRPVHIDASESERLLGYKFKSFEDQIVDVTKAYLGLIGKPAA